jgi:hypothetical protein
VRFAQTQHNCTSASSSSESFSYNNTRHHTHSLSPPPSTPEERLNCAMATASCSSTFVPATCLGSTNSACTRKRQVRFSRAVSVQASLDTNISDMSVNGMLYFAIWPLGVFFCFYLFCFVLLQLDNYYKLQTLPSDQWGCLNLFLLGQGTRI